MSELPDDDLGRLLAEGLARRSGGPVDADALVAGARAGAARIRRRRSTALAAAVVLAVALPVGALVRQGSQQSAATSAGVAAESVPAAGAAGAAAGAPGSDAAAPRLAASASASPSASGGPEAAAAAKSVAPLERTAAGRVVVPADALLDPASVPGLVRAGGPAAGAAPSPGPSPAPWSATCGRVLTADDAGSAAVRLEGRGGTSASTRTVLGAVRVFAAAGAEDYLRRAAALGCLQPEASTGADEALLGAGGQDRWGRTLWIGVARVGRVTTEVDLAVPFGSAQGRTQAADLLRVAVARLLASGLPDAAAADPALG